jgi:hypothetical protein
LYFNSNILDENTLQQKLVITYQNTSETNTYPEGDYENYMRVYIPENAEVIRVEGIENADLNSNTTNGLQEISGWVNVPIQTRKTLTITYRLERNKVENFPIEINPDSIITLQTNIVKQPGFSNDPLTIEVNYPQEWEPQDINEARRELNSLIKRTEQDTDKSLEFSWKR